MNEDELTKIFGTDIRSNVRINPETSYIQVDDGDGFSNTRYQIDQSNGNFLEDGYRTGYRLDLESGEIIEDLGDYDRKTGFRINSEENCIDKYDDGAYYKTSIHFDSNSGRFNVDYGDYYPSSSPTYSYSGNHSSEALSIIESTAKGIFQFSCWIIGELLLFAFTNPFLFAFIAFAIYCVINRNGCSQKTTVPQSNTQIIISDSDLKNKTTSELNIMRNEYYAKHGYTFSKGKYFKYFSKFPWYKPDTHNESVVESRFSPSEKASIDRIIKYQKRHNMIK